MNKRKIAVLVVLLALVAAFFAFDLGHYFDLAFFKARQGEIEAYRAAHPVAAAGMFFALYVAVTGLSVPGAAVLSLVAGALFGVLWGTVIVSFASSLGATIAFLVARFLLRDTVQERFRASLRAINRGMQRDGPFYLFTLRLLPVFPFFVINLAMGLTSIRLPTFYWVSQLGMLAGTVVYVNAGTQIARINSLAGILSPELIASFTLLGLFPLLAKKTIAFLKARKVYRGYSKPRSFDYNVVVIGAGSAGLVTAYIAAAVKARVALIEKHRMGGDCLNTGCVPSKALIRSARLLSHIARAREFGLRSASAEFDFAEVMERVQKVIRQIEPHDSVERYTALGVDCIEGEARLTSPWSVEVGGRRLTTRNIVIATGARPLVPPIPGLDQIAYLTSDSVWSLRRLPRRLLVLGGGPVGCELSQCFARFGARVTQIEMLPRLLAREDEEIAAMVLDRFRDEGVDVRLGHRASRFLVEEGQKLLVCEHQGKEARIEFDEVLIAIGRAPNTGGFGLEELGIGTGRHGTIETNAYLQTRYPNIYACGDVAGPYQFTHTAAHQAWFAAVNALFGGLRKFRADYSVIPWATFTDPEVARVGLNEQEARERAIAYEVTRYPIAELDRAIADGEAHGVVKVLTAPGKDRILGATIAGEHAADLIAEFVAAMRHRIGLSKLLGTIHVYPTLAEANKYAAGEWKKAHAPAAALRWLQRYHSWRRGPPADRGAEAELKS